MSKIVPLTKAYLDSLVDPFLAKQPDGVAFVIGYVGPGFEDFFFKGNLATQFGTAVTLGENTYFELASISKTFTATLAAVLGEKYLPVSWETQTIGTYNGTNGFQVGAQFNGIPLSTLLSYTSGLPADNNGPTDLPPDLPVPYSPAGMLGYLNMTSLTPSTPNSTFAYSNLGFAIMAQIAPLFSSGLPDFATLMSELVLDPLGMDHTFFFEDLSIDDFAQGYTFSTKPKSKVPPGWPVLDAYNGAGGVVSTPKDMMTWLKFNMGLITTYKTKALNGVLPQLQSPATTVMTSGGDQLGLSWFLAPPTSKLPLGTVWKDGEISGANTYIAFLPWVTAALPFPSSEAGVFVLTNCSALTSSGIEITAAIANDVLTTMQGGIPSPDKSNYPRVFGP